MKFIVIIVSIFVSIFYPVFAGIVQNPYMYPDTDNPSTAIYIHWKEGKGTVHYGIKDYSQTMIGTNEVHLTNLVPHAKYQWYLVVDSDTSKMGSFHLDPGIGSSFTIALFADTHGYNKSVVQFFEYAHSYKPDLIIILGDVLVMGKDYPYCNDFTKFFNSYPDLFANTIFVPVKGNHDDDISYWQAHFPHIPTTLDPNSQIADEDQIAMNYMFDYGNVSFSINTSSYAMDGGGVRSQRWTWEKANSYWRARMAQRSADSTLRPIVIALSHLPGWSYGAAYESQHGAVWYNGDTHFYARTKWLKINENWPAGIKSISNTQADGHMVYCHMSTAGGGLLDMPKKGAEGYFPEEAIVYHNCSSDPDVARLMSIVEVTGEGMFYHKAYKVMAANGDFNVIHSVMDFFSIDKRKEVAEYLTNSEINRDKFNLYQFYPTYPNPFNPECYIPYEIQKSNINPVLNTGQNVKIRIYNILGQVVKELDLGEKATGSYITKDKAAYWDGRNSKGKEVVSGVYYYELVVNNKVVGVKKALVVK